jgi:hypothetical protein
MKRRTFSDIIWHMLDPLDASAGRGGTCLNSCIQARIRKCSYALSSREADEVKLLSNWMYQPQCIRQDSSIRDTVLVVALVYFLAKFHNIKMGRLPTRLFASLPLHPWSHGLMSKRSRLEPHDE